MALVKCEYCGHDISDKASFCPSCGTARTVIRTTPCSECGAPVPEGAMACSVCGCPVETATRNQPMFGQTPMKYCQSCGATIPAAAIICTRCGCQTGQIKAEMPNIVINNANTNTNYNANRFSGNGPIGSPKNKWAAFLLCFFFGYFGAHKFYEGKTVDGLVYLFTSGLCGIGWMIDCIVLLFKPNPYYV